MRAIVVHGVEIPERLIASEAQHHPGQSIGAARRAAGEALATKALLLHRARELGLDAAPELDAQGCEETEEAALVRAVIEAEVEIAVPTEAECRRVYDAQPERFRAPMLYEAAHILIEPGSTDDAGWRDAEAAAQALAASLAAGEIAFAEAARDYSSCPSAAVGGSLGQMRCGDLVAEVEAPLLALSPGTMAPAPVRSRFGWHILKLERRIDAGILPFEIAEPRIRLHLESRAWLAAGARYVAGLAEAATARGIAITLAGGTPREGSACLGDLVGDLIGDRALAERLVPWLEASDPETGLRLRAATGAAGIDAVSYVRRVVADFVERATDDHWTRLISAARDAEDPARAALALIMKAQLETAGSCGTPQPATASSQPGRSGCTGR
ncbi:peptidylprolyl isomerase [Sphingomonadaceae bacterium jetA1]|jgi:peptidyl-prolyl cis-trans isomerase C|uniref:peptidylprolyl isomerase n=1 Tax=Facivitalis istanbulensis TaxID=3075838 RepID=UPI00347C228D